MKRSLLTLVFILAAFTMLAAQQAPASPDIKGAWDMTLETPNGSMPIQLTFAAPEGEKISGTLSSPQGDLAISGKLSGVDISFGGNFDANGQSIPLSFTGKVDGGTMAGDANFGGMGTATWSAKRK